MKLIIVGAGIAGLTAGVYARQSGIDTTILEMHSIPGGSCTSWKRKGYLFEGGMHWLVGSNKNAPLNRVWEEVGALQENNPVYLKDPFITYHDENQQICLYRNPERLKTHLMEVSPQDKDAIKTFVKDIVALQKMGMPIMDIKGLKTKYKAPLPTDMLFGMIKALPKMNKLNKITVEEYISKFKHPGIKSLLKQVVAKPDFTASSLIFTLSGLSVGDSGYPEGGSLRMAQNIAATFESLGGSIKYKQRVERICVREGSACGVYVEGKLLEADAVIVAADALTALDEFFDEPLHEPWMDELRAETTPLNCTFISLGVAEDLSNIPESNLMPLKTPLLNGGIEHHEIGFYNYAKYGYASESCTPLTVFLGDDTYDEWKLAKADGSYKQKKEDLALQVISRMEEVLPQIKGKVDVWDVATPLTYERYCGTYRGSWMSVMKPGFKRQQYPCKPESISHLYFAGQRIMLPGGMPVAASTGRQAVQHLCLDQELLFQGEYNRS